MSSPHVSDAVRLTYLENTAFWRRLMRRLRDELREMKKADKALLARRPASLPFDFDALNAAQDVKTAELKAAVRAAKTLPDGWFKWTKTSKRKAEAVSKAKHALRVWRHVGRDRFAQSEFARVDSRNRRISRKSASFDARPDVVAAKARSAAMAGVLAEAEGATIPEKALFNALAPVVSDNGKIMRINLEPAFDLLRLRAAEVASAEMDEPEPSAPVVEVPDVEDMEKAGQHRPSLDDIYGSLDALT